MPFGIFEALTQYPRENPMFTGISHRILIIALLPFCIGFSVISAQSFVYNGDFEIMDTCPDAISQLQLADGWFEANIAKADYFNACDETGIVGAPTNFTGYEVPHSGAGYAGIYVAENDGPVYREFIESALTEPLIPNHAYLAEAYISVADESTCWPSGFCIYLSSEALNDTVGNGYNTQNSLYEQSLCTETGTAISTNNGWMHISFCFQATGNEHFITLGNNFGESIAPCIGLNPGAQKAYMFVDDVALSPMPIQEIEIDTVFCKGSSATINVDEYIEEPMNTSPVYTWNDGVTGNIRTFTEEGTYTAQIANGCAVDTFRINVHWRYDCPEIFYFPNAFSPNGDGLNDRYHIQMDNITVEQLEVYNRWGKLVYSGINNPDGWDGTIDGHPAEMGMYVYVIRYKTNISEKEVLKTGALQLIR